MKSLYAIIVFSSFVVMLWYAIGMYMIYRIGKDMDLWNLCWTWIDKWLKWRYGLVGM